MALWRPQGGPSAQPPSRRLAVRPRLLPLEDRSLPSTTVPTAGDSTTPPVAPPPGSTATTPPATPPPSSTATTPPAAPPPGSTATTPPAAVADPLFAFGADAGRLPLVNVYDTATGAVKYSFQAYDSTFKGGVRVAVGDVTGDGVDDIVTAPGPGAPPLIKVYDGTTGQLLTQFMAYDEHFRGGVYVAVADVNGDGHADIITGAGEGGGPHVKVFNGAWAVPPIGLPSQPAPVMNPLAATTTGTTAGTTTAATTGTPTATTTGATTTGTTGTTTTTTTPPPVTPPPLDTTTMLLQNFMAYDPRFLGGVRVAGGDVNGDGKADIITAAGPGGGPHVRVFSGATGQEIMGFFAYASTFTGGVYVSAGDINGDGRAEIATGSGRLGFTQVKEYDGTGALLRAFNAGDPRSLQGVRVGMVDFDRDGKADLLTAVGDQVQVRDPITLAPEKTFTLSDPSYLNGVFVG
jgi:hypothetical protein